MVERYQRGRNGHLISSDNHGFYLFNARGDVVQRVDGGTNGSGNSDGGSDRNNNIQILHVYMYDAFGNEINYDADNENPFRFAGEYWDAETQTYYLRARHFNPRTGRFTQADPHWNIGNMQFGNNPIMWNDRPVPDAWAIAQSSNLYMYAMHNPVMFTDPSGEAVITIIIIGAVAGTLISGGLDVAGQRIAGKSWDEIDWASVAFSAGVGAISGGLGGWKLGPMAMIGTNAGLSFSSSVIRQGAWDGEIDWNRVAVETGLGALGGWLGGAGAMHGRNVTNVGYQITNSSRRYFSTTRIQFDSAAAAEAALSELWRSLPRDASIEIAITLVDRAIYMTEELARNPISRAGR